MAIKEENFWMFFVMKDLREVWVGGTNQNGMLLKNVFTLTVT